MTETVLSHLAIKLATHPENLATEALGFILRSSTEAKTALASLASQFGVVCPADLSYQTQKANDDGKRPDLIGRTAVGESLLFLEVKFWAGLTDAQPVDYLGQLTALGGLLLFVAPAQRLETLWSELLRRCNCPRLTAQTPVPAIGEKRHAIIGKNVLAIISWRMLLDILSKALDRAGDHVRAADVQQLQGLCETMDTEAFLPLHSEELTGPFGRRLIQFGELADDLTAALVNRGFASLDGCRPAGGNAWWGRYLRLKGYGCWLGYSGNYWSRWGGTPLWLDLQGPDYRPLPTLEGHLKASTIIYQKRDNGMYCVPIFLSAGVEREAVMADALVQLEKLIKGLPNLP